MMPLEPRYILAADTDGPMFSICVLVRTQEKYDRLLASFARNGFTDRNTEFLAADNRDTNRFDGYGWQKLLLAQARGRFAVFCHDDIELLDEGYASLVAALDALDQLDPAWLLAGVAGGQWKPQIPPQKQENWLIARLVGATSPPVRQRAQVNLHISDPWGEDRRSGQVPGRVETLDECFILMRRTRPVIGSYDLDGFHFYGADLCLQAELLGGSAYAIDFHLRHHGRGTKDSSFEAGRTAFTRKYAGIFPGRLLHCTTGVVDLTPTGGAAPDGHKRP